MAIIRAYAGLPTTYAPDVGEVVQARRSASDQWTRAVVLDYRRRRDGSLRVKVQWIEDDQGAGIPDRIGGARQPVVAGTVGWIVARQDPTEPPLVRQLDRAND